MQSQALKSMPPETINQRVPPGHPAHVLKTTLVETMAVKVKGSDAEHTVINRHDFDPSKHEELNEEQNKQLTMDSLAGEGVEGDPVREYRVFKDFPYAGIRFEKNSTVKLRKSVGRDISERFRCIWPEDRMEDVEKNPSLRNDLVRGLGGELEERDPQNQNPTGH